MAQLQVKSISNRIGHIILNRPESFNALNAEMLEQLLKIVTDIERSSDYRAIIISGSGNNFAAGADLKRISEMDTESFEAYIRLIQEVTWKLEKIPVLTIAAIDGLAYGGGFELALACDFRFSTLHARFSLPEINLGLIPGGGGTYRLTKLIGLAKAKRILYTGEVIKAKQAEKIGFIDQITQEDRLISDAIEYCESVSSKPATAFKAIKESASHAFEVDSYAARQMEIQSILSAFNSEDCKEGIRAFIEKREPNFSS